MALEAAMDDMARQPGVYGGRGIILKPAAAGPSFWNYQLSGWPTGNAVAEQVDFVGHFWLMETYWLRDLLSNLPDRLFSAPNVAGECGEDMYLSFVAQQRGIPTLTYGHGEGCNPRWSSIQAYEMGLHPNAMFCTGSLDGGEWYLRHLLSRGWKLLRF